MSHGLTRCACGISWVRYHASDTITLGAGRHRDSANDSSKNICVDEIPGRAHDRQLARGPRPGEDAADEPRPSIDGRKMESLLKAALEAQGLTMEMPRLDLRLASDDHAEQALAELVRPKEQDDT